MTMIFDNAGDADRFLSGCLCFWRGEPVYIDHVNGDFKAMAMSLPLELGKSDPYGGLTYKTMEIDIRESDFNCRNYTLGYANIPEGAAYFSRTPSRTNPQGLCNQNMLRDGQGDRHVNFLNLVGTQEFRDMLVGKYPTYEEVVAKVLGDRKVPIYAFTRQLAVGRHTDIPELLMLYYKGVAVGWGTSSVFTVSKMFTHLKEVMQEHGVKVVC